MQSIPKASGARLEVVDLNRSFDKKSVLKNISFRVEPGEVFVIMGPSGSGKTVLLKHLIGLEIPDSGDIFVAGENIHEPHVREHFRMAMVFQSGALLNSLSIGENVGLYLTEHRLKSAEAIAEAVKYNLGRVGLSGIESQYPAQLSGGMKKRVAIARALVIEPQLIFYDEPTSELDPLSAKMVSREIARLNQQTKVTSLIVTHDRELALGIADRIAILREGEILKTDTPAALKKDSHPFIQEFLLNERMHIQAHM